MRLLSLMLSCALLLVLAPLIACSGQPPEMAGDPPPPPAAPQADAAPPAPPAPRARPASRPGITRLAPEEQNAVAVPPAPAPPKTITLTIPAGTRMEMVFNAELSSGAAVIGDDVDVRLGAPLIVGERVVFAAGSRVEGKVTGVKPATKGYKDTGGAVAVSFDRIVAPNGRRATIVAGFTKVAEGSAAKKGAIIGGSAAGGAVLGEVLGKDAAGAALIGGAIGAAIAGATKGKEAILETNEQVTVVLEQAVRVTVKR